MDVTQLNSIIKSSKNILLTSHINPDGDTLGAMCGMYLLIKENLKKQPDMLVISKIPLKYEFLPNIKLAKHIENIDKSREYDLVINLDVASKDRICDGETLFNRAKFTVNIDHHKTNNNYADLNFVDGTASSASEVVYELAKKLNWKISLDTAKCIYTGILTDTGSFRFNNTTAKAFLYASELVEIGVSPDELYKQCYEMNTKGMALCQAYCINKSVFLDNDRIVYTTVYKKDIEKFNTDDEFSDGLTERLRAMATTQIAFVVKEMSNGWSKVSMRSKGADVAEICSAFGGGGHRFAAGCTVKADVENTIKKVLKEIKKHELEK